MNFFAGKNEHLFDLQFLGWWESLHILHPSSHFRRIRFSHRYHTDLDLVQRRSQLLGFIDLDLSGIGLASIIHSNIDRSMLQKQAQSLQFGRLYPDHAEKQRLSVWRIIRIRTRTDTANHHHSKRNSSGRLGGFGGSWAVAIIQFLQGCHSRHWNDIEFPFNRFHDHLLQQGKKIFS